MSGRRCDGALRTLLRAARPWQRGRRRKQNLQVYTRPFKKLFKKFDAFAERRAALRCERVTFTHHLLLLFFFILSGKLTKDAKLLEIDIPTAASSKVPQEMGDRDVINIDENGQLFSGNQPFTWRQLTIHLKERSKNDPPL